MQCKKCGYFEAGQKKLFGSFLCKICVTFAPDNPKDFQEYILERVDWKILDTFRNHGHVRGIRQKIGMTKQAKMGKLQGRPPLGYEAISGNLIPNENAIRVRSIFKTFLAGNCSLNFLSKNFSLSINGLKKILMNRTYLGEIKFDNNIYKGSHQAIINPEIFYAAQRKLKGYLNSRKRQLL